MVGNKIDLLGGKNPCPREIEREDAELLAKELKLGYIETSAKTKENICELFETIASQIFLETPFFGFSIKAARGREI